MDFGSVKTWVWIGVIASMLVAGVVMYTNDMFIFQKQDNAIVEQYQQDESTGLSIFVVKVNDEEAALEIFEKHYPDWVVLDYYYSSKKEAVLIEAKPKGGNK